MARTAILTAWTMSLVASGALAQSPNQPHAATQTADEAPAASAPVPTVPSVGATPTTASAGDPGAMSSPATTGVHAAPARPRGRSHRTYTLLVPTSGDLRLVSRNATSLHLAANDLFHRGVAPALPDLVGRIGGEVWSFFWTYFFTIWPHELGHSMRAREIGGRFNIHDFALPVPRTTMTMPTDASAFDSALVSAAGFEINTLMALQQRRDFYLRGEAAADTLAHALLQRSFFAIYTAIFSAQPDEPDTWIHTRGDPVHIVLPAYQHHTGRPPVDANGRVDPALSQLYKETALLGLLWPLLDPFTLDAGKAMFTGRSSTVLRSSALVGDRDNGWTFGTNFIPSPLGYELHLANYLWLSGLFIEIDAHYGRPAHNIGAGFSIPSLYERGRVTLGLGAEMWDQMGFGTGGAVSASVAVDLGGGFGLASEIRAKSSGYTLGAPIDSGATFFLSATFAPYTE